MSNYLTLCPFIFAEFLLQRRRKMLESNFQSGLKKELKERFPGCIVLKNDPTMIQGIPDLTVLYKDRWAFLEVKKSRTARRDPKQIYYINMAKESSYGSFIFPENKEEVLNELERSFGLAR